MSHATPLLPHRTPRVLVAVLGVVLVASSTAGCDGGPTGSQERTLRVFAAASLAEPFAELAEDFEADHPGTTVELNLGSSSGLAGQVAAGAPADVYASASTTPMEAVVEARAVHDPQPFASNAAQVAVPADNPAGLATLADLDRPDVKVAVCQPQVPCGAAAQKMLDAAGVRLRPVTEEADVRAVLTKVRLGEVDAGVVYVTDVLAAGDEVTGLPVPAEHRAVTTYPIASTSRSEHPGQAAAFVELVLSDRGRSVLDAAGFGAP